MTLQEKIDKLPLSVIFGQRLYVLNVILRSDIVRIIYRCNQPIARNAPLTLEELEKLAKHIMARSNKPLNHKSWKKRTKNPQNRE